MSTAGLYETLYAQILAFPNATNLCPNGGYETDTSGSYASGSATLARDSTYAYRGTYALKVTTTNVDSSGVYWLELDTTRLDGFVAGTSYTFSLAVYAPAASVGKIMQLRVQWYTAGGAFVSQVDTVLSALTAGWNTVSVALTCPATAARVSPYYVTYGTQGVFSVWVDRVAFTTTLTAAIPLSELLTGGLWAAAAPPENVTEPYGTMELTGISSGEYLGDRQDMELEVMLYHRPRSNQETLEGYADTLDGALLRYINNTTNVILVRDRSRQTIPAPVSPEDRDLCAVRLVYSLAVWPAHLTQYSS